MKTAAQGDFGAGHQAIAKARWRKLRDKARALPTSICAREHPADRNAERSLPRRQ